MMTAIVAHLGRDPALARASAEEVLALAEGRGFPSNELVARILLGWARASQGEIEEGIRDVEEGIAVAASSGAVGGLPLLYTAAAHVYRMAKRREQAEELIDLAEKKKLKIMVDHTFLYTGAVRKIKELMEDGTLGDLCYFDFMRVNLGLFKHDVNVVWDLAPHDLAIMDYLIKEKPTAVVATGEAHCILRKISFGSLTRFEE